MLWALVLPFQLTLLVLTVAGIAYWVRRRSRGGGPVRSLLLVLAIGLLALVPCCTVMKVVTDHFRFGRVHYESVAELDQLRVRLPPDATDITLELQEWGHLAAFRSDPAVVTSWLADQRSQRFQDEAGNSRTVPVSLVVERFAPVWPAGIHGAGGEWVELPGPRAPNGAGFSVILVPGGWCLLWAVYW